MSFADKSGSKSQWGDEPEGNQIQHNGGRRPQRDGDRRPSCPDGKHCTSVNTNEGCPNYHPPEHRVCRFDDKCTRDDCRCIHPSRAEGSDAPSQSKAEKKQFERPERSERPLRKAPQDNTKVSTDDAIEQLKQKLADLEKQKKIEEFKKNQRIDLEKFIESQKAELAEFVKSSS